MTKQKNEILTEWLKIMIEDLIQNKVVITDVVLHKKNGREVVTVFTNESNYIFQITEVMYDRRTNKKWWGEKRERLGLYRQYLPPYQYHMQQYPLFEPTFENFAEYLIKNKK